MSKFVYLQTHVDHRAEPTIVFQDDTHIYAASAWLKKEAFDTFAKALSSTELLEGLCAIKICEKKNFKKSVPKTTFILRRGEASVRCSFAEFKNFPEYYHNLLKELENTIRLSAPLIPIAKGSLYLAETKHFGRQTRTGSPSIAAYIAEDRKSLLLQLDLLIKSAHNTVLNSLVTLPNNIRTGTEAVTWLFDNKNDESITNLLQEFGYAVSSGAKDLEWLSANPALNRALKALQQAECFGMSADDERWELFRHGEKLPQLLKLFELGYVTPKAVEDFCATKSKPKIL